MALLAAAAVALPFVLVRLPPSTDLAQQVAQIHLLGVALADPAGPYAVEWTAPNRLSYALLGAAWGVGGAETAGRLALLATALLWVGAVHALAAWRGRPVAAALLASTLVFHHALYWGFLGFLLGFPALAVWLWAVGRAPVERARGRDIATLAAAGLLLYATHVLTVPVAAVWFVVEGWWRRRPPRAMALCALGFLPLAVVVAAWYPRLERRFDAPTVWGTSPLRRLLGSWWVEAGYGGLRGPLEPLYLLVVVSWIGLAFLAWRRRRRMGAAAVVEAVPPSRELLLAGLLLVALASVLPERYSLVTHFASRWAAPALVLLILAAPTLHRRLERPLAAALLLLFVATTAATWVGFERRELAGLEAALASLPPSPRLLGLDYERQSDLLDGSPFFQMFAYGQARRGGELNFSFADLATSLVVFDPPRQPGYAPAARHLVPAWTPGLEWHPERLRRSDLALFDHVLVHADPATQRRFALLPELEPVSTVGSWHLYRRR